MAVLLLVLAVLGARWFAALVSGRSGRPAVRVWHRGPMEHDQRFYGCVDVQGGWAVEPVFEEVREPSDGMVLVRHNDQWSYLDDLGNTRVAQVTATDLRAVPSKDWHAASDFSEGMAVVQDGEGRLYCIDKTGRAVFEREDIIVSLDLPGGVFHEGLAAAMVIATGKEGMIDTAGRWVVQPVFGSLQRFQGGLAKASRREGEAWREGVINRQGGIVVPMEYDDVTILDEDRIWLRKGAEGGIMDAQGKWLLPLAARGWTPLHGARCKLYDKASGEVMDKDGRVLFKAVLTRLFEEGLSPVMDPAGKEAPSYIDEQGRVVFRLARDIDQMSDFHHGLAEVWAEPVGHGLINREGKVVVWDAKDGR